MINNLPTIVKEKEGVGRVADGNRMKSDLSAACALLAIFLFRCKITEKDRGFMWSCDKQHKAGSCFLSLGHSVPTYQQYMLIHYQ